MLLEFMQLQNTYNAKFSFRAVANLRATFFVFIQKPNIEDTTTLLKRCNCSKIKIVVTFVFRECAACFNLGLNPKSLSNFRKQVWIFIFLLENTLKGIFYRYRTGMYIAFKAHRGGPPFVSQKILPTSRKATISVPAIELSCVNVVTASSSSLKITGSRAGIQKKIW